MDSPERVSSKMEPKYVTLEYCFILMPLYWMFSGLDFLILSVYSYHVTYAFQSESTLYNCLNIKELVTWSRSKIWSLSDCNWTQTQNHWVFNLAKLTKWLSCVMSAYLYGAIDCIFLSCQRQLNHLVSLDKWLSLHLQTKWFWVRVQLQSILDFMFAATWNWFCFVSTKA